MRKCFFICAVIALVMAWAACTRNRQQNQRLGQVANLLDSVAVYQQNTLTWVPDSVKGNHHDYGISAWTNAVFYLGLAEWAATGQARVNHYPWLEHIANTAHRQLPANFKNHPRYGLYHADEMCMGRFYLAMYSHTKDAAYMADTRRRADHIIANPADTTFNHRNKQIWTWCDALFMAAPVYAQLTALTGQPLYLNYMHTNFMRTYNHLYDEDQQLFLRDDSYLDKREANGQKVFWGRGNGWVIAALPNLMEQLPPDYPHLPFYQNLYAELAARLAMLQGKDGFWHASLLDPHSYPSPETSATALITYALAYGVNHNLLAEDQYLPVVSRGWEALQSAIAPNGRVGWVQPIGADPKKVTSQMTSPYGPGAVLMAGKQILELMHKNKL